MKSWLQKNAPLLLFCVSLISIAYAYGLLSYRFNLFPKPSITSAVRTVKQALEEIKDPWFYVESGETNVVSVFRPGEVQPGLTRVDILMEDKQIGVKVVALDGSLIHQWNLDWFRIWPDATHIPNAWRPKSAPGTNIHGAVILDNGDLVFNFENLGLVRLDPCGNVIWKLARLTHHSVHLDDDGFLWMPAETVHDKTVAELPNHRPPFREFSVLKVSLDGEVLKEISVMDVLRHNDLNGLMYLSSTNDDTKVTGDTMHLNDVETFPDTMEPGVFSRGDIMISLRNINTVLVFDPETLLAKHVSFGGFIRQHDPDFIDGNTISIYDNNHDSDFDQSHHSRIVIESATTGERSVFFEGNAKTSFYSGLMGKHQWLENGNLLITEARNGRAMEVNPQGDVVWAYNNLVGKGVVGIMSDAHRMSQDVTPDTFKTWASTCPARAEPST